MVGGELGVDLRSVTAEWGRRAGGGHRGHRQSQVLVHQRCGETGFDGDYLLSPTRSVPGSEIASHWVVCRAGGARTRDQRIMSPRL